MNYKYRTITATNIVVNFFTLAFQIYYMYEWLQTVCNQHDSL